MSHMASSASTAAAGCCSGSHLSPHMHWEQLSCCAGATHASCSHKPPLVLLCRAAAYTEHSCPAQQVRGIHPAQLTFLVLLCRAAAWSTAVLHSRCDVHILLNRPSWCCSAELLHGVQLSCIAAIRYVPAHQEPQAAALQSCCREASWGVACPPTAP